MLDQEQIAKKSLQERYNVSRETMERLDRYRDLLKKWSKQINLVGPSTVEHFWNRHALDCAQLLDVFGPDTNKVADFGSGAGFPGLILSALLADRNPNSNIIMIESSAKRCGFLREAARTLEVNVAVRNEKIEAISPEPVDYVTARAFAPLHKLLDYAHPWAEKGAKIVFLKGEDVQGEIEQASTNWSFRTTINKSLTDSRGCILEIFDLQKL